MVKKLKLLIAGDSFAAQWPDVTTGWVNLLEEYYTVTNIAQAGVSEYKILKQIESQDLTQYDIIIVSHTSPSRVHTTNHPLHKDGFHKDCDLIFNDIADRISIFNKNLAVSQGWFKYHYDEVYQIDMYNLIREKINALINIPYISLSHVDIVNQLSIEKTHIDFSDLWKIERGTMNHYTYNGNCAVFKSIKIKLLELEGK
jgi:hypothetical protein